MSEAIRLLDRLAQIELTGEERRRALIIAHVNARWEPYEKSAEIHAAIDAHVATLGISDALIGTFPAQVERADRLASDARSRMATGSLSEMLGGVDPATVVAPRCTFVDAGRQCVDDDHGPDIDHRFA